MVVLEVFLDIEKLMSTLPKSLSSGILYSVSEKECLVQGPQPGTETALQLVELGCDFTQRICLVV